MKLTGSISRGAAAEKHNTRECYRDEAHTPDNIDRSRSAGNVVLVNRSIEEVYRETFGAAADEYNARQVACGHPERQIHDYLEKVRGDKKLHPMYEFVVQVGNMDEHPDADTASQVYEEWLEEFRERFGAQFIVKQAIVHVDEATPHMHLEVVPCARSGRGLPVQNSLNKAIRQSGFSDYKEMLAGWDEILTGCMASHGIERVAGDREKQIGGVDINTYKRSIAAQKAAEGRVRAADEELARKRQRCMELTNEIAGKEGDLYEIDDAIADKELALEAAREELAKEQRRLESLRQAGDRAAGRVEALESVAADIRGFADAGRARKREILDRVAAACDGIAAAVGRRIGELTAVAKSAVAVAFGGKEKEPQPSGLRAELAVARAAADAMNRGGAKGHDARNRNMGR